MAQLKLHIADKYNLDTSRLIIAEYHVEEVDTSMLPSFHNVYTDVQTPGETRWWYADSDKRYDHSKLHDRYPVVPIALHQSLIEGDITALVCRVLLPRASSARCTQPQVSGRQQRPTTH